MNVCLIDVDGHHFPNYALMKISTWHKRNGDTVEWYDPLFSRPDKCYASKVFTFTPDYEYFPDCDTIKGGTGYDVQSSLPDEIEDMDCDYSIYPEFKFAIGFLSRGCIRNCPWCVVPEKEGKIKAYRDIERVAQGRKHVVLMDNNFLANEPEYVKEQLEKSVRLNLKIDFNQALDARLVTEENAVWLAKCKWKDMNGNNSYIRFSCDTSGVIGPVKRAITILRKAGYNGHFFIYFLAIDPQETGERIREITEYDSKVNPFCMPYRNLKGDGRIVNDELKDLARWCNIASVRKSCKWSEYKRRVAV